MTAKSISRIVIALVALLAVGGVVFAIQYFHREPPAGAGTATATTTDAKPAAPIQNQALASAQSEANALVSSLGRRNPAATTKQRRRPDIRRRPSRTIGRGRHRRTGGTGRDGGTAAKRRAARSRRRRPIRSIRHGGAETSAGHVRPDAAREAAGRQAGHVEAERRRGPRTAGNGTTRRRIDDARQADRRAVAAGFVGKARRRIRGGRRGGRGRCRRQIPRQWPGTAEYAGEAVSQRGARRVGDVGRRWALRDHDQRRRPSGQLSRQARRDGSEVRQGKRPRRSAVQRSRQGRDRFCCGYFEAGGNRVEDRNSRQPATPPCRADHHRPWWCRRSRPPRFPRATACGVSVSSTLERARAMPSSTRPTRNRSAIPT